jgi:hypothetical protein
MSLPEFCHTGKTPAAVVLSVMADVIGFCGKLLVLSVVADVIRLLSPSIPLSSIPPNSFSFNAGIIPGKILGSADRCS